MINMMRRKNEPANLILGKGQEYSLDTHKTRVNNNVLVVGASGAGKTRGIVIPNILQKTGSYVITDPKGNLYDQYHRELEKAGYVVRKLDFTHPLASEHYNFMDYVNTPMDVLKVADMLVYMTHDKSKPSAGDPFWDQATCLLLSAVMAYLMELDQYTKRQGIKRTTPLELLYQSNLRAICQLISRCQISEISSSTENELDVIMKKWEAVCPDSFAVSQYKKFRIAAGKTLRSILITANATIGVFDTPELAAMTAKSSFSFEELGQTKTALFVTVSDTDRSLDGLVNLFFTQAMNALCSFADEKCGKNHYALPVPVRFIMDDFATNCTISSFPRMISSIRSRDISVMLMIQSESQLEHCYGKDGETIVGNCDNIVYLGTNNLESARAVAQRVDLPLKKVLYMPIGTEWIFRRGQEPVQAEILDLDEYLASREEVGFAI